MRAWSTLALHAGPHAPRAARHFVEQSCARLPAALLTDALLLTSELVTNAVVHGQPPLELLVSCDQDSIHVEVHDHGAGPALPMTSLPEPTGADALGGRGLHLLAALADDCGLTRDGTTTSAWFTLRRQ